MAKLKPPGKWSHESTIKFYDAHNGDVHEMIRTIHGWDSVADPGAFASQIADYVRGTTFWRGPQETRENPLFKRKKKTDWLGGWKPDSETKLNDDAERLAEGENLEHIQRGFKELDAEIYDQFKLDTTKKGNVKQTLNLLDTKVVFERALEYRKDHEMDTRSNPKDSYRNADYPPEFPAEHPAGAVRNPGISKDLVEAAYNVKHKREMEGFVYALKALQDALPPGEILIEVQNAASIISRNLTTSGKLKKRAIKMANPSGEFPAEHPRSFVNPSQKNYTDAEVRNAERVYKNFTGENPKEITIGKIKAPATLVLIGKADTVVYEVDKHGQGMARYEHRIEGKAKMWWDDENRAIWIQGGLHLTRHGIEG